MTAVATGLTPTGVVVSTAKPLTDEWFAARREGITATDIPKILGDSDYGNAVSVWLDKRGEWQDDLNDIEAAEWGRILEDVVAREWAKRNDTHVAPVEMLGRKGALWMRASLDRVVRRCPTGETGTSWSCGLEVKTRSAFTAGRWRDDQPDDVLAQVAWQRMVTGYHHIHTACLLGGQRLLEFTYHRDEQLEDFIYAEALRVWQHVLDGTPPDADPNALLARVLDRMYPNREGTIDVPVLDTLAAIDRYESARLDEADAKSRKDSARAELISLLGEHEAGLVEGKPAFTYRASVRHNLDVRRLRADHPGIAEDYTTTTPVRSIRIARDYQKEA